MTTPFFIRAGRRDDITGVDTLLSRSYPRLLRQDYPPSILVTAIPLISRAQPDLITCGTYYVAEAEGGLIIGCGGWTLMNPATRRPGGHIGSIRHFATDPDILRQGVGSALMDRCLLDARAAGISALDCLSTRTAVPFYAAQGFENQGETEVSLRDGIVFPAVKMHRVL